MCPSLVNGEKTGKTRDEVYHNFSRADACDSVRIWNEITFESDGGHNNNPQEGKVSGISEDAIGIQRR
jgi:hypothetical protein